MKLNLKFILSGALAVGLVFSVTTGRADSAIGGQLYTPVNLKLVFNYYDGAGKVKKLAVASKDILHIQGFAKNSQLARGPGGDIYVVEKGVVMTDLTAAGYFSMDFNQLLYSETHPNGGDAFSYTESGTLAVNFYSDAGLDESSGHNSVFWFEIAGAYTGSGQVSSVKNNTQAVKENIKSSGLNGEGFNLATFEINSANSPSEPVSGSISGSGSGKVLAND